jgi:hypothetical protein
MVCAQSGLVLFPVDEIKYKTQKYLLGNSMTCEKEDERKGRSEYLDELSVNKREKNDRTPNVQVSIDIQEKIFSLISLG